MPTRLFFLFFFLKNAAFAQNYVVNGGFERDYAENIRNFRNSKPCTFTGNPNIFDLHVESWHTFKLQTPDLLEIDTTKDLADCPLGLPRPHRGSRMLGLIMFHPGLDGEHEYDYHEYVEGKLARPITPGKNYRVSFWVRAEKELGKTHLQKVIDHILPRIEPVLCGNFGFYFSTAKSLPSEDFRRSIFNYELRPQVNFAEIVSTPDGNWKKLSAVFRADEPFAYFVFGNFFSDAVTPTDLPEAVRLEIDAKNAAETDMWKKAKRIGYYCFDDFSVVEEVENAAPPVVSKLEKQFLEEKKITFSATVLFDFDKSELKTDAQPSLDELADFLKKNKAVRLEIGGHTDDAGTTEYNLDLSARRADAVCKYLISKEIDAARLVARGFGEAVPVSENEAENRRVECRGI